jgi:hypothetical protein
VRTPRSGGIALAATFNKSPASMNLHKNSPDTFELNPRGFHRISKQAHNH